RIDGGRVIWLRNPLGVLNDTYEYLNMAWDPKAPAAEVIWQHDHELLARSIRFYVELRKTFGLRREEFWKLNEILKSEAPLGGYDEGTWDRIRAAHLGFEAGNELIGMLFVLAEKVRFFDFRVEPDLEVSIPPHLADPELQARMKRALAPPPATRGDEIVAAMGGMYYGQEAPGHPRFVQEGMHVEKGQPLYIVEVMKMFNTVRAPFAATIDRVIFQGADGTVVQKGQPLFKVTPDERPLEVDSRDLERQRRSLTAEYLRAVLMSPREKLYEVEPREPEEEGRTWYADFVQAV
ncbi:MAG TPA: biotin/lipoyl-containing protein, partial [Anaeromyxobacteraceae bacterium]